MRKYFDFNYNKGFVFNLGALGETGMLSAVIADVGVAILAILNSLRALTGTKEKHLEHKHNELNA